MYCGKCGRQIEDGSTTCIWCGAPTNGSHISNENHSSKDQQPKSNLPTKHKKPLMYGIIGSVVIIAVVISLFAILIPSLNPGIDISKYIVADIYESSVLNTFIPVSVHLDNDTLIADYPSLVSQKSIDMIYNQTPYFDLTEFADFSVSVNNNETEAASNSYKFNELSTEDIIHISINWKEDEESKSKLNNYQNEHHIKINTLSKSFDIKVSDIIKEKSITVREPVVVDIFAKMEEMNALSTGGFSEGLINFGPNAFYLEDFDIGEYHFELINSVYLYDVYLNDSKVGEFKFSSQDATSLLKTGDTVTLSVYDDLYEATHEAFYNAQDTSLKRRRLGTSDLVFEPTWKQYKISAPTPLTAKEAKENNDMMMPTLIKALKLNKIYNENEELSIKGIDYIEVNGSHLYDRNYNILYIIYTTNTDNNYHVLELDDAYIEGNFLRFCDCGFGDGFASIDEIRDYYRDNIGYTKIM